MNDPLRELEVRAATIDELLSDGFSTLTGQKSDSLKASSRLAAWCRASAGGDWHLFGKRIARDGLTFEAVLSRFATAVRNPEALHAPWTDDCAWINSALIADDRESSFPSTPAAPSRIPFTPLLTGLVRAAENRLLVGADGNTLPLAFISDSVLGDLRDSLLRQLSELSSPAIFEQLLRWRVNRTPSENEPIAPVETSAERHALFLQFVAFMRAAGFADLFTAKPILLRLMTTITRQWIDTSREFLCRFQSDRAELRRFATGREDDCALGSVRSGLSDLHNHGRSVLLLVFEDKSRILYKPKDLRPDSQMTQLIDWLNNQKPPLDLRVPRMMLRDHYGWTEFIEHTDAAGKDGASLFYTRAGAWLALFHLLCVTDMHLENMIAAGDYPVPVDFEMICQPEELESDENIPERRVSQVARRRIGDSVLAVGLLPAFARTAQNSVVDLGGLGGSVQNLSELYWTDVDSIEMKPSRRPKIDSASINVPTRDGVPIQLADHIDSLQTGFEAYGRFLITKRREMLAREFFTELAGVPLRILFRPTRFYAHLIDRLKDVRNMDDGAAWSADLDFASRLADWDQPDELLWPLVRAERKALAELNVPLFFIRGERFLLSDADGPILEAPATSGVQRAMDRVASFDEQALTWQNEMVRMSLESIPRRNGSKRLARKHPRANHTPNESKRETFARCADSAFTTIRETAIRSGPGAAWIGLDWLGDSEACQLIALGPDLYNGVTGIALFLAAYARHTGNPEARELALTGLAPLRSYLRGANASRMARSLGIGAATGLGSIVYALTAIGDLLGEEDVLADATVASGLITSELLITDEDYDVIGGSAGAILSLLKLYRRTGGIDLLHRAVLCASHLIGNGLGGVRAALEEQPSLDGSKISPIFTGAAHGAAGLAMALAALYNANGDREFARGVADCIAYENALFSLPHMNWPDIREGMPRATFPCQWCYGAAGIGLTRVAILKSGFGEPAILLADIERALRSTTEALSYNDTLCCGDLGNIEFLYEASRVLGDTVMCENAEKRMEDLITKAEDRGDYRWVNGNRRFSLGLFRGLAGVGYTALRRLEPTLPNVLMWE